MIALYIGISIKYPEHSVALDSVKELVVIFLYIVGVYIVMYGLFTGIDVEITGGNE
ncbi:hypothetical protein [Natrinema pallidum]|uniref:hypothetical protein n=1 Tax=Natrinema pallidum TaxID=69527 RepID=UPI001585FA53|nr:hypothetical protein [Natrinema pallidum]